MRMKGGITQSKKENKEAEAKSYKSNFGKKQRLTNLIHSELTQ